MANPYEILAASLSPYEADTYEELMGADVPGAYRDILKEQRSRVDHEGTGPDQHPQSAHDLMVEAAAGRGMTSPMQPSSYGPLPAHVWNAVKRNATEARDIEHAPPAKIDQLITDFVKAWPAAQKQGEDLRFETGHPVLQRLNNPTPRQRAMADERYQVGEGPPRRLKMARMDSPDDVADRTWRSQQSQDELAYEDLMARLLTERLMRE